MRIEAKLDARPAVEAAPPKAKHTRKTVARLSDAGMEALELALEDIARPFTMRDLVALMINITPGCCTHGGEYYDSVRAGMCELQGLAMRYSYTRS